MQGTVGGPHGTVVATAVPSVNAGVLPGASVRITNTDTGASQDLVTNGSGYFEAPLVQPGNYEITVEMSGFKKVTRTGIVLAVSQQMSIPFTLEIGGATRAAFDDHRVRGEARQWRRWQRLQDRSAAACPSIDKRHRGTG